MIDPTNNGWDRAKLHLAADLLRSGKPIHLRALGTSMLPVIWPGDLLSIEPLIDGGVASGEIVLIFRDERFFVHRVAGITSKNGLVECIARGDSLSTDDPAMAAENILGRVTRVRRGRRSFIPQLRPKWVCRTASWILSCSNLLRRMALLCYRCLQKLGELGPTSGKEQEIAPSAVAMSSATE